MNKYYLDYINQSDFENLVLGILKEYENSLKAIDLRTFNSNLIDPIKLLFDKYAFNKSYEEIINYEIHRQRDKSNSNSIGYFHQNIFKFIKNCEVPKEGWDIIFKDFHKTYYIELKNKHNTMNSSSSAKTYMRMQNHLLNAKDKDISICALVEIIAIKSQNIPWIITLDKIKQQPNESLRRISIDKFYEIVTGDKLAFLKLCKQLPITIEKLVTKKIKYEKDTVLDELKARNQDILIALYKLAFATYEGFERLD